MLLMLPVCRIHLHMRYCWVTSDVSDSVRPHRRQPTRLPHPWDSPGKNPGLGCHFLLQCMEVKNEREVVQSCPTLSDPMDCSPPGSSIHGIFQARGLEWGAIAFSVTCTREMQKIATTGSEMCAALWGAVPHFWCTSESLKWRRLLYHTVTTYIFEIVVRKTTYTFLNLLHS